LQQADVLEVQSWLVRLLRRADRGRRLIRSINTWLDDQDQGLTEQVMTLLTKTERLIIYGLKRTETQGQDTSGLSLKRSTVPIRMIVKQWDSCMADLLLSMRETIDPFDVGHYDQQLIQRRIGQPCRRCGTPLESYFYGRGETDEEHRVAYLCCVCGPVSEHRKQGLKLEVVENSLTASGRENLLIRTRLHKPDMDNPLIDSTAVSLRFFDKARNECVHTVYRTVPAGTSEIDFRLSLPEVLSPDLHSVRLVAVSGFDFAYARLRFACLPSPELSVFDER
jgi:hypothetical protein